MAKPRIAGVIALNKFPMWKQTLKALCELCDNVYIRFDAANGDPHIYRDLAHGNWGGTIKEVVVTERGWQVPQWREDGLRLLDKCENKPDIVLCPDEDEIFDEGIKDELDAFWRSDKNGMMFNYHPLESDDGRQINGGKPYPPDPHMKAYKWKEGLSYFPYHWDAKIAKYHNPKHWFLAKTKIRHYAAYTKAMQEKKRWRSDTPMGRGERPVTILGFGPSSKPPEGRDLETVGEVWSMNNVYDTFPERTLKRITRIYDMHRFGPRTGKKWEPIRAHQEWLDKYRPPNNKVLANGELVDRNKIRSPRSGKLHTWHLNRMAELGARVVMLEPHADILDSEAYPLDRAIGSLGVDWFDGTPAYMIAQAIMEGYTHIRMWGVDQMDWEHTNQRACCAAWLMYGLAQGVTLSGAFNCFDQVNGEKHGRYGYDFGPEWSPEQSRRLWYGHPHELNYKVPSRACEGRLFDGGK